MEKQLISNDQFNVITQLGSIWAIETTLSGAITPGPE